jgi:hypothetical protein
LDICKLQITEGAGFEARAEMNRNRMYPSQGKKNSYNSEEKPPFVKV